MGCWIWYPETSSSGSKDGDHVYPAGSRPSVLILLWTHGIRIVTRNRDVPLSLDRSLGAVFRVVGRKFLPILYGFRIQPRGRSRQTSGMFRVRYADDHR